MLQIFDEADFVVQFRHQFISLSRYGNTCLYIRFSESYNHTSRGQHRAVCRWIRVLLIN